jgi:hypothetical protein
MMENPYATPQAAPAMPPMPGMGGGGMDGVMCQKLDYIIQLLESLVAGEKEDSGSEDQMSNAEGD